MEGSLALSKQAIFLILLFPTPTPSLVKKKQKQATMTLNISYCFLYYKLNWLGSSYTVMLTMNRANITQTCLTINVKKTLISFKYLIIVICQKKTDLDLMSTLYHYSHMIC